jgi:hypothetical protein
VLLHGDVGSSAGGEQPKFLVEARSSLLVKFSPPLDNPIGRRVGDLLICEHLAHEVLRAGGFPSARSRSLTEGQLLFLEVERFDRVGLHGRRGILSLRALDLEFSGSASSWGAIARDLVNQGVISLGLSQMIREIELFGDLIGNSDMHPGNLSVFIDESLKVTGIAPVYDMLPMMYYPRQNQLIDRDFYPSPPKMDEVVLWKKACKMALQFWGEVSMHPEISSNFRALAKENQRILEERSRKFIPLISSGK